MEDVEENDVEEIDESDIEDVEDDVVEGTKSDVSDDEETIRTVLVLDPAASSGYSLMTIEGKTADIYSCGFIDVDTTSDYVGDHCINLMKRIQKMIDAHNVCHIAVEDYFFSKKYAVGCTLNVAYRTAIHIVARQNGIGYTILNVSAWKTFVAGRASPTREQKKLWGKDAKKLFIQQALWDKYKFRFPNHSISEKSRKPIAFRKDTIDVVGQSVYYAKMIENVSKITMSVKFPNDVVLKRVTKPQFVYPLKKVAKKQIVRFSK